MHVHEIMAIENLKQVQWKLMNSVFNNIYTDLSTAVDKLKYENNVHQSAYDKIVLKNHIYHQGSSGNNILNRITSTLSFYLLVTFWDLLLTLKLLIAHVIRIMNLIMLSIIWLHIILTSSCTYPVK